MRWALVCDTAAETSLDCIRHFAQRQRGGNAAATQRRATVCAKTYRERAVRHVAVEVEPRPLDVDRPELLPDGSRGKGSVLSREGSGNTRQRVVSYPQSIPSVYSPTPTMADGPRLFLSAATTRHPRLSWRVSQNTATTHRPQGAPSVRAALWPGVLRGADQCGSRTRSPC